MPFDVTRPNQISELGKELHASLYKNLHEASKTSPRWVALSGFPVGIASGLLLVATTVGSIAECLFKGLLNIGGSCCVEQCKFSTGAAMIAEAAIFTAVGIPLTLLVSVMEVFTHTFNLGRDPENATHQLWMRFDPDEKKRYEKEQARTWATEIIKTEPENATALMILADWAKEKKNYKEWLSNCEKAAKLENKDALYQMGMFYSVSDEQEKATNHLVRAAEAGSELAKQLVKGPIIEGKAELMGDPLLKGMADHTTQLKQDKEQMNEIVQALKDVK